MLLGFPFADILYARVHRFMLKYSRELCLLPAILPGVFSVNNRHFILWF